MAHISRAGGLLIAMLTLPVLILLHKYYRESIASSETGPEDETSSASKPAEISPKNKTFGGVANFRYPKRLSGLSKYDEDTVKKLSVLIERKAPGDDAELVSLVKTLIDAPSDESVVKMSRVLFKTPQAEAADELLSKKKHGFFVEAGANDGERSSNSIFLEVERGWTGLLVEMDPYFYAQVLGRNRKSWSINACLSPYKYVTMVEYIESSGGSGKISLQTRGKPTVIPCFPLETLLAALDRKTVDFFSLDVEGVELEILKTIPYDRIDIKVLAVEYVHGNKSAYRTFMETQGYRVHKDIHVANYDKVLYVDDFIFVKN